MQYTVGPLIFQDGLKVLNFPVSDEAGDGVAFQQRLVPDCEDPFYRLADGDYACYTRSEPGKFAARLEDAHTRGIMADAIEKAGGRAKCFRWLCDSEGEPNIFTTWPIVLTYISIQSGKVKVGGLRSIFADNTVRALLETGHQTWLSASDPEVQAIFAKQALPQAVDVDGGRESPAGGNGPPTPEAPEHGQAAGEAVGEVAVSDPKGKGKARAAPEAEESTQFYSNNTEGAIRALADMGRPNRQAIGGDGAGPSRVAGPDTEAGPRRSTRKPRPTLDNEAHYSMYQNKPLAGASKRKPANPARKGGAKKGRVQQPSLSEAAPAALLMS